MDFDKDKQIFGDFEKNIEFFKRVFQNDDMLRIRTVNLGDTKIRVAFLFFDGMVDSQSLEDSLVRACVRAESVPKRADLDFLLKRVLYSSEITKTKNVNDILSAILNGDTLLLFENSEFALTVDTKGWETRSIDEPSDERVLQGPREGFDESAILNLALIRRKLQTSDLCIKSTKIGRRSNTAVYICYLGKLADTKTVEELKKRLSKICIDGILDSNYIAENIRDHKLSIFKTTGTTERPDIVASKLLEGRIAVVVDGTPVVLTLPYLFCENFQADEDYYLNFIVGTLGRLLRYACFFISISVPSVFIALTTFHIQLLPTAFMLTVSELRSGVPFSSVVECLGLAFVFEILKETGLRTPQGLGSALSIVGGLVVGQAAVEARIISAPMLIAVSLSGVAGLMIPKLKGAVFYLRMILIIAASLWGLFGYMTVMSIVFLSAFSIKSFGVDYTLTLKNPIFQRIKDTTIRAPWDKMFTRPDFNKNKIRSRKIDD